MNPCTNWDTSRRRCLVGLDFPRDCNQRCTHYAPTDAMSRCLVTLWHQLTASHNQ